MDHYKRFHKGCSDDRRWYKAFGYAVRNHFFNRLKLNDEYKTGLICEKIDPVFSVNVFRQCRSQERYKQPPAMRVRDESYTKTPRSGTMRMFRPYCRRKESFMANQYNSLAHTKWLCK